MLKVRGWNFSGVCVLTFENVFINGQNNFEKIKDILVSINYCILSLLSVIKVFD